MNRLGRHVRNGCGSGTGQTEKAKMGMRSTRLLENAVTLLVGAIACYALLVIAAYLLQDRLLYFPDKATRSQITQSPGRLGLTLWPDGEDDYLGLVSTDPPTPKGTILIWHGNA
jgi:hypothetical protein